MEPAFDMPLKSSNDNAKQDSRLDIRFGGCSLQGLRDENQDALIVKHPTSTSELELKGSIACIADGVSCSDHGQQASHTSVMQFVSDYYATPASWTIKHSVQKVLKALNSWLFSSSEKQNLSHNGLVTTFSSVIFKSNTAHIFHVGDSRIYLYRKEKLRLLTRDHQRSNFGNNHYLTRALGMDSKLDIDYQTVLLEPHDQFLLTTDGVHDYLTESEIADELNSLFKTLRQPAKLETEKARPNPFENLSKTLCQKALDKHSKDNTSALLLEISHLPNPSRIEYQKQLESRSIPPALKENNVIDGFKVLKVLYAGARSHVYLVEDVKSSRQHVLKTPSLNAKDDQSTLNSFYIEQWAGMHLSSPKIMRVFPTPTESKFLYQLCEPVDGITLRQWMHDTPSPKLDTVRQIIAQVISAVRVLQRAEMVHRDLKPENIMVLESGDIKLIDLGAVFVKGLEEVSPNSDTEQPPLGAANYIAPEYLNGEIATTQSDLFSVAVICYEMLTGDLPYKEVDTQSLAKARHQKWQYQSLLRRHSHLPAWLDLTLKKGCHPNPKLRYQVLSEFMMDLTNPNVNLQKELKQRPLLQRHPNILWKCLTLLFATLALVELLFISSTQ